MLIEGAISVKAVLNAQSREIYRIILDREKRTKDTGFILAVAKDRGIPVELLQEDEISAMTEGKTHGGIAAETGERIYVSPETLFAAENPFVALIEGVEDPYNFGDALRSLYAAGATGLILPQRNWLSAANVIVRSSAGASELLPAAVAGKDGFPAIFADAKSRGIKVFCAERKNAVPMYEANFRQPLILAIGGELRGLSAAVTENADQNCYIPYGSNFRNSLSASAACAVLAFEIMRQREVS